MSEVSACWPFSPELLELLEDHILMLRQLRKRGPHSHSCINLPERGESVRSLQPLTSSWMMMLAAFNLCWIPCNVRCAAELREVAQRNFETVKAIGGSSRCSRAVSAL